LRSEHLLRAIASSQIKSAGIIIALAALSNIALVAGSPFLRLFGGVILFCFLPGFLLLALILPKPGPADFVERVLLSAGASYVFSTLSLLALVFLPGETTLLSLLLMLDCLIAALLAWCLVTGTRLTWPHFAIRDSTHLISLIVLVALAAFFRFAALGYSEYQGDEIDVAMLAREILVGQSGVLFSHRKGPVEIIVSTAFALFYGRFDELALRLPFALASFLTVIATYMLGRRMFSQRVALLAGALLAIEGIFLGFSRMVQYQGVVALMLTLTVYCFYRLVEEEEMAPRYQLLGVLFFTFGLLTHYETVPMALPVLFLCGRKGLHFFRQNKRTLLTSAGILVGIILAYYVPFLLSPYFGEIFSEYVGHRVSVERGPFNNLALYFSSSLVYNSVYYLIIMFASLSLACAIGLKQAQERPHRWLIPSLLFALGLVISIGFPSLLSLGKANYSVLLFLPLPLMLALSRRVEAAAKTIVLWFFSYFILYAFVFREPGLHYYCLSPAWALLAALGVDDLSRSSAAKVTDVGHNSYQLGITAFAALLYAVLAFYTYIAFIEHDIEYILSFPQHRMALYWVPWDSLPRVGLFGFPHKSGWKTVGYLYKVGLLRGDHKNNEGPEIVRWYLRETLPPTDQPRYLFVTERSTRQKYQNSLSQELIDKDYNLVGKVLVDHQPRLFLYEDKDSSVEGLVMECEAKEYEALYNETDSLADYRFYREHGGEEVSFRNVARFLEAVSLPGDGLVLNAPEQVSILSYYYRGQLPYYPLPEGPTVEEETTEAQVRGIMAGHNRVHALFWGAEERDPHGLIEGWLGQYGHKATERHFGNLRLVLYTSDDRTNSVTERYLESVRIGDRIELAAYRLSEDVLEADRILRLTLYWQAVGQMDRDYTVFTHLIDSSNRIWAQHDSQPQGGQHPTSHWVEGQVVVDEHELILALADNMPPGEYEIEVGMYDWESGERLTVSKNGQWIPESRVILKTVH
jgi:4-amino-4-deoxy-L-arabinose transferase-like glycosyltransferase